MSNDDTEQTTEDTEQDTELAPTVQAPEPAYAWSHDETAEIRAVWHGRVITASLVTLTATAAAAAVWLGATYFNQGTSKPERSPIQTTTAVQPAPSTPVAAPPPAPAPVPAALPAPTFDAVNDQRLLSRLVIQDDYTITNSAWALENAHRYCVLVQQGIPTTKAQEIAASESLSNHPVGNEVGIEGNRPWTGTVSAAVDAAWDTLTTDAMIVYPHCGTR